MTEHTVSAYCLLWVYVVQESAGAPLGRAQCSVTNFPAKENTLFSTSPSGVVKSSCWFQVRVPHRPRTLNTAFTLLAKITELFHELEEVKFLWFLLDHRVSIYGHLTAFPCGHVKSSVLENDFEPLWGSKTLWSVKVTLFAKPGCRVMRAKGPSKCQSIWAPNVWIRRNEEEALRTARSPVTTGNASLWPFSDTVPGYSNTNCKHSEGSEHI